MRFRRDELQMPRCAEPEARALYFHFSLPKVAWRPFAARKNGPFSRLITDEKSISHETQRGRHIYPAPHIIIKWLVGVGEENFCPKPLSFG